MMRKLWIKYTPEDRIAILQQVFRHQVEREKLSPLSRSTGARAFFCSGAKGDACENSQLMLGIHLQGGTFEIVNRW